MSDRRPPARPVHPDRRAVLRLGVLAATLPWTSRATADEAATEARCAQAATRLRAGEAFAAVRQQLGDDELAPLPDAALPPGKLRDYLGPTALRTVLDLSPGAVSDPVRSGTGFHVLQVIDQQPASAPPFDQIRTEVLEEYRRRAGERALRAYLDDLRRRANVVIAEPLP